MPYSIDIPTILFSLTCINFSAVILIFIQSKFLHHEIDLTNFIINKLLQGASWLLQFFIFGSDSSFILVASMLFILGVGFESALFLRFKGKLVGKLRIAILASALIASLSPLLLQSSVELFEAVLGVIYMFYIYLIAGSLFFGSGSTKFQKILGLFYGVFPLASLVLYHFLRGEVAGNIGPTSLGGYFYYILLLFTQLVGSIGYILMVLEKSHIENVKKNLELQKMVNDIDTLSGLMPICSGCGKTRDDEGYWERLEDYLRKHTQVDFSHSLCPHCCEELYPDLDLGSKIPTRVENSK